jgi:hypothetical protein
MDSESIIIFILNMIEISALQHFKDIDLFQVDQILEESSRNTLEWYNAKLPIEHNLQEWEELGLDKILSDNLATHEIYSFLRVLQFGTGIILFSYSVTNFIHRFFF